MTNCSLKALLFFHPCLFNTLPPMAGHVRARAAALNLLMSSCGTHTPTTQTTQGEAITVMTREHTQSALWEMLLSLP